jgi:hypothetical protein
MLSIDDSQTYVTRANSDMHQRVAGAFRPDPMSEVLRTPLRYRAPYWSSPYSRKYLANQPLVFSQASWAASG